MKLEMEVVLACLVTLIWIQQGLCDEFSNTSGTRNWTCTCSSFYPGKQSDVLKSNCSRSCDCSPVEPNGGRWKCICATDGFPKVANNHDTTCFTACNCTAGSLPETPVRKNYTNRVVVIVLLLCVILTTLAFLASLTCYLYRKDKCPKCPIRLAVFSSDKETSCNSATNLISHMTSSASETKGCFQSASFLCWNKTGTVLGTICQFAYSELENATNKFSDSNLIGLGGSSYVYRGQLKDGRIVAVKRLKIQGGGLDADSIFSTEVELLSRLHHCHVVPLLGYCSESGGKHADRLLVFEYMPNGNLRDCLDGILGETMSWETRVRIAIGAARGLEYLHEAAAPRILHRDVKSTNILLDKNWRAKITDLGMAKRLRADGLPSCSSSPARMQGTFGYFAPEYAVFGKASLMTDVFSFGVVLLELITGRQPIHKSNNREESLVIWATPRLQDSKQVSSELPDSRLKGNFPEEEMQVMAYLAKECLLLDPDTRPTMSEVVQILSTIAPDKSKRRNIPVNFYQMSSAHNMKNDALLERHQTVIEDLYDTEDHMSTTSRSAESSVPSGTNDIGIIGNQTGILPAEYCMERLVLLSSNARSSHVIDDEAVDLIEPRFESFGMVNVKSP
ncbi:Receptor-like serine/threonine-protein kinase NCRK [Hibiscus syriacus]|uniref:non-specific serine/threonine protein kinase n=1 Tax=Hibiscus syriacus TaxID=106335 RepID=A0A6A2XUI6_HIBSY|nr:receptor-like serine/threonine-protein kinase NCRK [Hibiscus syriacus]XP_039037572.1 receptor-like serine/threonine-protein kinase NCRK [Hibiscus syriacus]XP_039037573.1 receptor-like serine/threonine-protein kinase NCRK [Hibiscus syriacus]XP_039037574.1 receptor-like serine/threonine-protein kinase NCRK [Hibiscus syriacus]KAE8670485.1 Receptor-like serine/threonine-protein kinase NCRK [Hibiscus syriacus]